MKDGINIILYPRTYNKRGDEKLHSVLGVTSSGKEINVKLRIDESYKETEYGTLPSIAEFSRDDRKAKQVCMASPDNGPDNREGMLLFNNCQFDGLNGRGIETYVARWAVVLCEHSESPEPIQGIGRLHINRYTQKTKDLSARLNAINDHSSEEAKILKGELANPENYTFPAVIYHPEQTLTYSTEVEPDVFIEQVGKAVNMCGVSGMVGGFAVRAIDGNGDVLKGLYIERYQRFIRETESSELGEQTARTFIETGIMSSISSNGGVEVSVIPLTRIPAPKHTNSFYSKENTYRTISGLYESKKGNPKLCNVIIRPTYHADNDNTFLSRIFNLTSPLGHPMRLTRDGSFDLRIQGEKLRRDQRVESIIGGVTPITVSTDPSRLTRAFWMISNEPDLINAEQPHNSTVNNEIDKDITENIDSEASHLNAPEEESESAVLDYKDDSITIVSEEAELSEAGPEPESIPQPDQNPESEPALELEPKREPELLFELEPNPEPEVHLAPDTEPEKEPETESEQRPEPDREKDQDKSLSMEIEPLRIFDFEEDEDSELEIGTQSIIEELSMSNVDSEENEEGEDDDENTGMAAFLGL